MLEEGKFSIVVIRRAKTAPRQRMRSRLGGRGRGERSLAEVDLEQEYIEGTPSHIDEAITLMKDKEMKS